MLPNSSELRVNKKEGAYVKTYVNWALIKSTLVLYVFAHTDLKWVIFSWNGFGTRCLSSQ